MAVPARRLQGAPARRRAIPPPGVARPPTSRRSTVPAPRSKPRSKPRSRATVPFVLLSAAVVTALVVGLVSAQTLLAQGSFRLQELRQQAERLEEDFREMRLRADMLSALDRIERAGRAGGLVYPDGPPRVLTLPREEASDGIGGGAPGVDGAADLKAALGAEG